MNIDSEGMSEEANDEVRSLMEEENKINSGEEQTASHQTELAECEISEQEYRMNLFKMTIMWCEASFCTYVMLMLNKYLEGTIFINFLMEGLSGLLGAALAAPVYEKFKLRGGFVVSLGLTLLGAELIYAFEEGVLDPSFVVDIGLSSPSNLPKNSAGSREYYLNTIIPILGFITKIGLSISF